MIRRVLLPLVPPLVAAALVVAYGLTVPLPHLFPYSDAVLLGALALLLALGLACLMPDQWLFTAPERLRHLFMARHQIGPDQAETSLGLIERAMRQARRLRDADNGFDPTLGCRVEETADSLECIAHFVFDSPGETRSHLALVNRADLLVEAVEDHAKLRSARGSDEIKIGAARTSVAAALDAFAGALSAADQRRIETQLERIDTATDVADTLFSRMKGTRS